MNKFNSAIAAGYSKNTAINHTKELDERVKIYDVLERQGLTDNALIKKHKELLEAHKVMIVDDKIVDIEKGGIKIPELFIQIKALELAYKLKDLLRDKIEHSGKIEGDGTKIIIIRDGNKTQAIPRPIHFQQGEVSGDDKLLGNGEVNVRNISGNDILRADTK